MATKENFLCNFVTDQSLKLVVVAFPVGAQDYENSTTTGLPVFDMIDWLGTG